MKKLYAIAMTFFVALLLELFVAPFQRLFVLTFILYALLNIIFKDDLKDKNTIANGFMIGATIAYLIFLIIFTNFSIFLPTLIGSVVGTTVVRLFYWDD